MRIVYLSISYLPSRRASSVHVMKMCAALARAGHLVTLTSKGCRQREEPGVSDEDLYGFYGVEPGFEVVKLPRPAWRGGGAVHMASTLRLLLRRRKEIDLVYSRDLAGAAIAAGCGLPVVFEAHVPPEGAFARRLFRYLVASPQTRRVVTISSALHEILGQRGLLEAARVSFKVAHDAADPFTPAHAEPPSPSLADTDVLHVGYVGNLYAGRGIELILDLAGQRPDCRFHLVGGDTDRLGQLRAAGLPANVVAHGFVPPAQLHDYYARFAVVLMPYQQRVMAATGRADIGAYLSPMKLFEYMAAGRAILASDLPSLREVLEDERTALLLPPDRVEEWDRGLARLIAAPELRRQLGAEARAVHAQKYTWDQRALAVLRGL